ncbi:hypothetical protein HYH03_000360 [Edaphochlamys debaryana]|uniref:DUF1254 domain-containing protein n=1 Tax=Edaphochlamys debaryana TaxID=47281 RepID=A0A835YHC9_9CHLO|nr:hypothetical protein HYH03_000360 [Edaphochlamys debaryana]|eukprot:KAG2501862.1 hypothetical protein HYH03_000360 [Edaphochlamys debaryana]
MAPKKDEKPVAAEAADAPKAEAKPKAEKKAKKAAAPKKEKKPKKEKPAGEGAEGAEKKKGKKKASKVETYKLYIYKVLKQPDAYDTLLKAGSVDDARQQSAVVAALGATADGIKFFLQHGASLGSGLESLRPVPANLTADPGLSLLATAVQAWLAFYPATYLVPPQTFNFWKSDTNAWYHDAVQPAGTTNSFAGGVYYSSLYYSLRDGPLLLTTPEFKGLNLWTINFYEAFSNAFFVIGAQYGSNKASSYLLVPPGWDGDVPDDAIVVHSPTVEGFLLGRSFIEPDAAAIKDFNAGWTASALGADPADPALPWFVRWAYPENPWPENTADPLLFWRVVGEVYRRNGAPYVAEPLLGQLSSLGLWRDYGLVAATVSPLAREALAAAQYYALRIITAWRVQPGPAAHNYWLAPKTFGFYGSDLVAAAGTQRFFPIVNRNRDALYYFLYVDAAGTPFNFTSDYEIIFQGPPPIANYSFWSLVAGGATWSSLAPDLYTREDGTIPFRVSSTRPAANTTAEERGWNWVPSTAAGNYIVLRLYAPLQQALDNLYVPPPVTAVAGNASAAPPPAGSRRSTRSKLL